MRNKKHNLALEIITTLAFFMAIISLVAIMLNNSLSIMQAWGLNVDRELMNLIGLVVFLASLITYWLLDKNE